MPPACTTPRYMSTMYMLPSGPSKRLTGRKRSSDDAMNSPCGKVFFADSRPSPFVERHGVHEIRRRIGDERVALQLLRIDVAAIDRRRARALNHDRRLVRRGRTDRGSRDSRRGCCAPDRRSRPSARSAARTARASGRRSDCAGNSGTACSRRTAASRSRSGRCGRRRPARSATARGSAPAATRTCRSSTADPRCARTST